MTIRLRRLLAACTTVAACGALTVHAQTVFPNRVVRIVVPSTSGVTSLTRASGAPEIPTLHKSGLPGFEAVQWYGLLAPAGTPREITDKIHRDATAILRMPEVRDRLNSDGAMVVGAGGESFAAFIRSETVKWAKVVKAAGIVPE
jgi:tripartite-type tricarboxylate transporter receptor subunit TctC